MRILVVDTETSGLPPKEFFNKVSLTSINMWPYIIQLSYIVYDTHIHDIDNITDNLIKIPKHVNLREESIRINGITNIMCENRGIPIYQALVEFNNVCQNVDIIVGHNLDFDINMLKAEWYRLISQQNINNKITKAYDTFGLIIQNKQKHCTLRENITRCNLISVSKKNGKTYTKWPTLDELHQHLFQSSVQNLHNALVDVIVCLRCFYKINMDADLLDSCIAIQETIGTSLRKIDE